LAKAKDLTLKAKDLTFKAKAKDSKFVLEDISRPRTKAKDNNTDKMSLCYGRRKDFFKNNVNIDVKVTSKREE